MRNRAYRREKERSKFIKRLKNVNNFRLFRCDDGEVIYYPLWIDLLKNKHFYIYKSVSTTNYDSQYKDKYRATYDEEPKILSSRLAVKKETRRIIHHFINDEL